MKNLITSCENRLLLCMWKPPYLKIKWVWKFKKHGSLAGSHQAIYIVKTQLGSHNIM